MARITVEDCLHNVDNRFDLVIKAAKRAHELEMGGSQARVPLDNDKPTVLALREIAAGFDVTAIDNDNEFDDLEETTETEGAVSQESYFIEDTDI